MPNTYTQLYVHLIFAVAGRANLISKKWKDDLYKYITGIITNKNQKLMIINGMPDHLHLLIGLKPDCKLSDLVRDIKANSSKWVNDNKFLMGRFEWQTGFSAFTVGYSQIQTLIDYILRQEDHHRKKSFREEYTELLVANQIEFKSEYLIVDFGDAPTELDSIINQ